MSREEKVKSSVIKVIKPPFGYTEDFFKFIVFLEYNGNKLI